MCGRVGGSPKWDFRLAKRTLLIVPFKKGTLVACDLWWPLGQTGSNAVEWAEIILGNLGSSGVQLSRPLNTIWIDWIEQKRDQHGPIERHLTVFGGRQCKDLIVPVNDHALQWRVRTVSQSQEERREQVTTMNIFRLAGDMTHLLSIIVLFLKIRTMKSCAGISLKTQELYVIVFVTRYLDLFTSVMEVLWSFSLYLEAVAILPQLKLLQRSKNIDNLTGNYVFLLGAYRALYLINWIYRFFTENHRTRWIPWISGLVQTALYADFFYYYIKSWKNHEKLKLPA
ncbi:hypothetical protein F0562_031083 [Nyssa sinensis]|uniref:ER lumen protein-retaining receptor n=1 Tax=Nyssa sinensis TaxID=561372 RepID=A0A5J5AR09_9ASTE|nr:hypothetical protein F0562_031083 [Nyssa sinensis]